MSIERAKCPVCGAEAGFDPSDGSLWCPACGYQYGQSEPEPEYCDACGEPLESSQIGNCDACQEPSAEAGDIIVTDKRGTAREQAEQYGNVIAEFWPESRDAVIRAHMDHDQFWPDCWYVSDHGNATRITFGQESDPARAVWCGSIGWRDCDPMTFVAGFDQSAVEARIAELMREETERANDEWEPEQCADCARDASETFGDDMEACQCGSECDCDDPDLDDLIDYGTSAFTLAEVIRDCIGSGSGDQAETLAELMRDGITTY